MPRKLVFDMPHLFDRYFHDNISVADLAKEIFAYAQAAGLKKLDEKHVVSQQMQHYREQQDQHLKQAKLQEDRLYAFEGMSEFTPNLLTEASEKLLCSMLDDLAVFKEFMNEHEEDQNTPEYKQIIDAVTVIETFIKDELRNPVPADRQEKLSQTPEQLEQKTLSSLSLQEPYTRNGVASLPSRALTISQHLNLLSTKANDLSEDFHDTYSQEINDARGAADTIQAKLSDLRQALKHKALLPTPDYSWKDSLYNAPTELPQRQKATNITPHAFNQPLDESSVPITDSHPNFSAANGATRAHEFGLNKSFLAAGASTARQYSFATSDAISKRDKYTTEAMARASYFTSKHLTRLVAHSDNKKALLRDLPTIFAACSKEVRTKSNASANGILTVVFPTKDVHAVDVVTASVGDNLAIAWDPKNRSVKVLTTPYVSLPTNQRHGQTQTQRVAITENLPAELLNVDETRLSTDCYILHLTRGVWEMLPGNQMAPNALTSHADEDFYAVNIDTAFLTDLLSAIPLDNASSISLLEAIKTNLLEHANTHLRQLIEDVNRVNALLSKQTREGDLNALLANNINEAEAINRLLEHYQLSPNETQQNFFKKLQNEVSTGSQQTIVVRRAMLAPRNPQVVLDTFAKLQADKRAAIAAESHGFHTIKDILKNALEDNKPKKFPIPGTLGAKQHEEYDKTLKLLWGIYQTTCLNESLSLDDKVEAMEKLIANTFTDLFAKKADRTEPARAVIITLLKNLNKQVHNLYEVKNSEFSHSIWESAALKHCAKGKQNKALAIFYANRAKERGEYFGEYVLADFDPAKLEGLFNGQLKPEDETKQAYAKLHAHIILEHPLAADDNSIDLLTDAADNLAYAPAQHLLANLCVRQAQTLFPDDPKEMMSDEDIDELNRLHLAANQSLQASVQQNFYPSYLTLSTLLSSPEKLIWLAHLSDDERQLYCDPEIGLYDRELQLKCLLKAHDFANKAKLALPHQSNCLLDILEQKIFNNILRQIDDIQNQLQPNRFGGDVSEFLNVSLAGQFAELMLDTYQLDTVAKRLAYEAIAAEDPMGWYIIAKIAKHHGLKQHTQDAVEQILASAASHQDSAHYHYVLARTFNDGIHQGRDVNKAIACYQQALACEQVDDQQYTPAKYHYAKGLQGERQALLSPTIMASSEARELALIYLQEVCNANYAPALLDRANSTTDSAEQIAAYGAIYGLYPIDDEFIKAREADQPNVVPVEQPELEISDEVRQQIRNIKW